MFSPSLTSMILHSIWPDLARRPGGVCAQASSDLVAEDLRQLLGRFRDSPLPMPSVPALGQASDFDDLGGHVGVSEIRERPGYKRAHGRVPVDLLIDRFQRSHAIDAEHEFLDLGVPLLGAQQQAAGLGHCQATLARHPHSPLTPIRATVAVIDRGENVPGKGPDTLGGRVHHVFQNDVEFSDHASWVFYEVIERLATHNLLKDCELVCALIAPPSSAIGRECFKHANLVEMQDALDALAKYVAGSGLPLVTNLSMGCHVGPHDGHSPIEDMIDSSLRFADQRYLVCSAGNDGLAGRSARRELRRGERDVMRIRTSSDGLEELLVELWWEEPQHNSMVITVTVSDRQQTPIGMPLTINTNAPGGHIQGSQLATAGPGFKSVVCESLYQARCRGKFSCAAFAMTTGHAKDLADLRIDIELRCDPSSSVAVNAWIVVAKNNGAEIVGGGSEGSITIPATYDQAISVAGVEDEPQLPIRAQPWRESSRGPTSNYGTGGMASTPTAPKLAHLVKGSVVGTGTSFAAPRAAGDVVETLLVSAATVHSPLAVANFADADDLAKAVVHRRTPYQPVAGGPDPRIGYGAIT